MLSRGNKYLNLLLLFLLVSCSEEKIEYRKMAEKTIGKAEYNLIYAAACDSIKFWALNNLGYYQYLGKSMNWQLDSLICFNSSGNRLISCILKQQLLAEGTADNIDFLYGERLNDKWYFYSGENIFLPRSAYNNDEKTPLNFLKLHEIALKEVYSGYLNSFGQINEDWFTQQFENVGWCADCRTHEDFQKNVLKMVAGKWANRDTTQPIKHLNKPNL